MGTLLWETLPKIHYSFGNRSSIHCSRENNGNFLVAEPRSPTQVIPKPRSGKNPEMLLTISKHCDASEVIIKVTLLSLFGVPSARAERSFTAKIVRDFPISISTRPVCLGLPDTRVGTLIVANIYLQLIQNRYMFRSFTVLHCSHQHCVQPVASDVKVVGYL